MQFEHLKNRITDSQLRKAEKENARHDTGRGGMFDSPTEALRRREEKGQLRHKTKQPYLGGRI